MTDQSHIFLSRYVSRNDYATLSHVKRWTKRILLSLLAIIIMLGVTGLVLYKRAYRVPQWYQEAQLVTADPNESTRIENTRILPMQNWIAKNSSELLDSKTDDQRQHTIDLSASDINVLIVKWGESIGIQNRLNQLVKDLRVRIYDGKITIAGRLVEQDVIMSFIVEPLVGNDGSVELKIDSIKVGDATVPMVALDKQKSALSNKLLANAQNYRDKIRIDSTCSTNHETASFYSTLLATRLFAGQSYPWYLFVTKQQGVKDVTITRVKQAEIKEDKLKLTLQLLAAEQREKLVDSLKSEIK